MHAVVSLCGLVVLLCFAWLLSHNRKAVNWRVVGWGLGIQFIFALFIFVIPAGSKLFLLINDVVNAVLDSATEGTKFVFGPLAVPPGTTDAAGNPSPGFILATQSLATIVFFAALVSVLYYVGVMDKIIQGFAWLFTRLMRISGAESLVASSNIFVGVEASLMVKPYLAKMTRSELNTVLTAGMATIASSMLAAYVMILRNGFPTIAGHLVSASILNAPAAIIMSKLLYPEEGHPETLGRHVKGVQEKEDGLFASIINGANSGVRLVVGIVALLLAFLGLVALVNKLFLLAGNPINSLIGIHIDWSLKGLLGYLFYPFTVLLGIPLADAGAIAKILGERVIVTEVVAFQDLASLIATNPQISPRSVVIATYALTGFAHVASLAIFVGGIAALVPARTRDLSSLGFRALLGATLATMLTATIAGLLYTNGSVLLMNG